MKKKIVAIVLLISVFLCQSAYASVLSDFYGVNYPDRTGSSNKSIDQKKEPLKSPSQTQQPNVSNTQKSEPKKSSLINPLGITKIDGMISVNEYTIIPIMYHKLSENPADLGDFCTTPQKFEEDIKYFKENNYEFMLASELNDYVPKVGDKKVVITFDDGYKSDFVYALPILEKYSVKATFYVVGEFIDTYDYMTKEEIKSLSDSPYAEIGNHSYSLHKKSYEEIQNIINTNSIEVLNDFQKNKRLLTEITKKEITTLTYPNGLFTVRINAIFKTFGYKTMFSTGVVKYRYGDVKPTGRINRNHNYTLEELLKIQLV